MDGDDVRAAALLVSFGGTFVLLAWWRRTHGDRESFLDQLLIALAPTGFGLVLVGVVFGLEAQGHVPGAVSGLAFLLLMVGLAATIVFVLWLPDRLRPPDRSAERAVLVGRPGEVTIKLSDSDGDRWLHGTFPAREAARQAACEALGDTSGGYATLYEAREDGSAAVVEVVDVDGF